MELFAKIVHGCKSLNIFAKNAILDVFQGSEYVAEVYQRMQVGIWIQ